MVVRSPCQENYPADAHPSALKSVLESANPAWTWSVHLDAPGQRHGQQPVAGTADPGVVKQNKSSRGSVDTTKTRSGPQRVRMNSGERPIGAATGKQSDTEALWDGVRCSPRPHSMSDEQENAKATGRGWGGSVLDPNTRGVSRGGPEPGAGGGGGGWLLVLRCVPLTPIGVRWASRRCGASVGRRSTARRINGCLTVTPASRQRS